MMMRYIYMYIILTAFNRSRKFSYVNDSSLSFLALGSALT